MQSLHTARLTIREYTVGDLADRARLMREAFGDDDTNDEISAWLAWTVQNYRQLERLYQPPYGDYAVTLRETDTVIGSVGLVPSLIPWRSVDPGASSADQPHLTPEMGLFWAVLPEHQGRGYALEAAQMLVEFVFETLHLWRVVATTEFENVKSVRVMEKLGMTIQRNAHGIPEWFQVVGVLDYADWKLSHP